MVKGPAQEIQFLGVKWQDGHHQIPMEVINNIAAMSPLTKKETQAFLGAVGFWRMHTSEYSMIVSPLYLMIQNKNDFQWSPEEQQAGDCPCRSPWASQNRIGYKKCALHGS